MRLSGDGSAGRDRELTLAGLHLGNNR